MTIDGNPLLTPAEAARGKELLRSILRGLDLALLGQQRLTELVAIAVAARGHLLLEGLPGLGKTELVKALASLLSLSFRRIQFTPDLLPSDITGGVVLEEQDGHRVFRFHQGPLFANLVLADEINRASPKTQSALLEAMQERRVTVLGETHSLPEPHFVLATQNPIELEGTYPLPEAQLDRFLFKVDVLGVGEDVLAAILTTRRRGATPALDRVMTTESLRELFALVDRVFLPKPVANWIARIVTATHPQRPGALPLVTKHVKYGASPRAAIAIAESARAAALLAGRPNVDFADVERTSGPALAHRLVLQHTAKLDGITANALVGQIVAAIPALEGTLARGLT